MDGGEVGAGAALIMWKRAEVRNAGEDARAPLLRLRPFAR